MHRFYLPTEVVTGAGCFAQFGETVARFGQRAMIVCGQTSLRRSGLMDRAIASLREQGLQATVYDRVTGEANLATVEAGIALARDEGCDVFVGIGGGSAIDTAKAIAGLVNLPGTVWEYHDGRPLEFGGRALVTLPTTSGTGAEVTKNAVLINPETRLKQSIRDDAWFARVALVDPELTLSMPPDVTARTGSDALCQAIESYTSIAASPVTDALAGQAIALISRSLVLACRNGDDIGARSDMSFGATMAGMAMASARLGGVHGMAHPLGSRYDIAHGIVCGVLLPHTMAYNLPYAITKYAHIAGLMGEMIQSMTPEAAAQRAVERVRELVTRVGIPQHLSALGVQREGLDQIIAESLPSGSLKHNPRPLDATDVRRILESAM